MSFRAELRSQDLFDEAWLELSCSYTDRRSQASEERYRERLGETGWKFLEVTHLLHRGQRPDLIRVCLVTAGAGTFGSATPRCS
ncbi:MAG: hypothetical protein ACKJSK_10110 [Roseibacillus sp.]